MSGFIFVAVIAVVVVSFIIFASIAEKKRRAAIEQAATELGLAFSSSLPSPDRDVFDTFQLSQIGHSRDAACSITADSGELRMVLFDYTYTTGGGKNKNTKNFNVVMASSEQLDMPQFSLSPESFFHRVADFFGYKDIDFDDDTAFSDKYLLKGGQEEAIREFFTAKRRSAFMKLDNVMIEAKGNEFIFYRGGKQRDLAHLRSMLEEGFTIYGILQNEDT